MVIFEQDIRGSVRGGAGGSMDPPAFQTKVSLNMKVFALKPDESRKTEFGPPGIKFLTEPLVSIQC